MKANEIIRKYREERGLSETDLAKKSGLSIHEYSDLEDYEDELYTVISIAKVKRICDELGISLIDVYALQSGEEDIPDDIVKLRMKEAQLSITEISDKVGINEQAIQDVLEDIGNIQTWVIEPILDLAKALKINPASILNKIS